MRRLLFRGRTKDGRWCYGDYVHAIMFNGVRGFHKDWIIPGVYGNGGWVSIREKDAVDGDTVGQYTGLMDKNGVKVFEGDIIKTAGNPKRLFIVFWSDKSLQFVKKDARIDDDTEYGIPNFPMFEYEVVGNIYDNPELLEEES